MSIPLTKETMAAAYDYLHTTPPFSKWNLPFSEDVTFKVSRRAFEFGCYYIKNGKHNIEASSMNIGYTDTLMKLMSHEMIHLYLEKMGWESKSSNGNIHNKAFKKFAKEVCEHHGFDLQAFC
jgi:hypothetical protein